MCFHIKNWFSTLGSMSQLQLLSTSRLNSSEIRTRTHSILLWSSSFGTLNRPTGKKRPVFYSFFVSIQPQVFHYHTYDNRSISCSHKKLIFRIKAFIHYYPIQWKLFLSAKTLESKLLKVLKQYFKQVSPSEKLRKDSSSFSVIFGQKLSFHWVNSTSLSFLGATCFHDI